MSTIKVDTIATRTGSGNITASNTIAGNITGNVTGNQSGGSVAATTITASGTITGNAGGSVSAPALGIVTGGLGVNGIYSPAANSLGFVAGGAVRGRFTADGLLFGTDTASANALDDYEIGTFTPSYMQNGTTSYGTRHGSYVKIGNLCQVWWDLTVNSQSGASSTALLSLPFAAASSSPLNSANSQNMGNWWFWDVSSNYLGSNTPSAWIPAGNSNAYMYKTNGYASGHANWNINTTGRIACSVMYFTES